MFIVDHKCDGSNDTDVVGLDICIAVDVTDEGICVDSRDTIDNVGVRIRELIDK